MCVRSAPAPDPPARPRLRVGSGEPRPQAQRQDVDKGVAKAAGRLLPPRPAAISSPSFPPSRSPVAREVVAPGRAGLLRWIYPPRCRVLRLTHLPGGGPPLSASPEPLIALTSHQILSFRCASPDRF